MKQLGWRKRVLVGAAGVALMSSCVSISDLADDWSSSPNYRDGKFHNLPSVTLSQPAAEGSLKRFLFERDAERVPSSLIPVDPVRVAALDNETGPLAIRLGHSAILLRLGGEYWLTDPAFSKRASPVQWLGPKRFHPVPLDMAAMPDIAGVVISHDHYDHLDKNSIQQLHHKVRQFYVPLGIGQHLANWGVPADKITELDWWQEASAGPVTLVATPSQHFSGRTLTDRNETLWASWVLKSDQARIFFSGDTGYFDGFKTIGERYGPFDLTLIETGAYDEAWPTVHMKPEQSLQAHMDLNGKAMIPIHNGTFNLAMHSWYEPFERVIAAGDARGQTVLTPRMGEVVRVGQENLLSYWWRDLDRVVQVAPVVVGSGG